MNKILILLIGITLIISSCKAKQEVLKSDVANSTANEKIGHIKIGLLSYEIIDTINMNTEMAEMMISGINPSLEVELVYSSTKSAELKFVNNQYSRVSLYDRTTKILYKFLKRDTIQYYAEVDINKMMNEIQTSDDELKELSNMFKIGSTPVDILGFKCEEVTMMQPSDYSEVHSILYTTSEIPHLSEAMGPMSKYMNGAPIKTIMFVNGLKVTIGAKDFNEDYKMSKYLSFDKAKYQKLTVDEFEMMN